MPQTAAAQTLRPLRVDFVADLVCPWCYLGWRKLLRALDMRPDVAAQIHWIPFQLRPDHPLEGVDRPTMMRRFMPAPGQVEASYAKFKALGAEVGIDMRSSEIKWSPNTGAAHRLLLWADQAGRAEDAIERVFAAYWTQLRDIGDMTVLADIGAEIGLDRAEVVHKLASGVDADTLAQYRQMTSQAGITGVPAFAFDGRIAAVGAEPAEELARKIDLVVQG